MTATEVLQRCAESKAPAPQFDLSHIVRTLRRAALRTALDGSSDDRLRYCIDRAAATHMSDFVCFGHSEANMEQFRSLTARWFDRLERLAARLTR